MVYVVLTGVGAVVLVILAFMAGFNFAIKKQAAKMLEEMHMGTIIFDVRRDADETFQCHFDKNPRQMLDKEFVLMEVKIRR